MHPKYIIRYDLNSNNKDISRQGVDIDFNEHDSGLNVSFRNWAECPQDDEMPHLTERGFRSKIVANKGGYEGSGLGLYLLKQICEVNNVKYEFEKKDDVKFIEGVRYQPFVLTLFFSNI